MLHLLHLLQPHSQSMKVERPYSRQEVCNFSAKVPLLPLRTRNTDSWTVVLLYLDSFL